MQKYIIEILLFIITTILGFFLKYIYGELKRYKTLLNDKDKTDIKEIVQQETKPVIEEIHRLEGELSELTIDQTEQIHMLMTLYKFRVVQLCIAYLKQGYMTPAQFEELAEFYRTYTKKLGGNGQAQEYYERVTKLPIKD